MRVKFLIAYDGRAFAGWQSQPNGEAVQDVIEAALAKIAGIARGAARFGTHGCRGACASASARTRMCRMRAG